MKNAIIGIVIGLLFGISFIGYKYYNFGIKYKSMVTYCDSLRILANKPPDTTVVVNVVYKDVIKWRTKFDTIPADFTNMQCYKDSLINDSINLKVKIYANNLYWVDYTVKPIIHQKTVTIEKNVPYPVIKECPELPKNKLISLSAGLTTQLMPAINVGYKKINVSLTYSNGKPLGMLTYQIR